jgi:hypothetical protein
MEKIKSDSLEGSLSFFCSQKSDSILEQNELMQDCIFLTMFVYLFMIFYSSIITLCCWDEQQDSSE